MSSWVGRPFDNLKVLVQSIQKIQSIQMPSVWRNMFYKVSFLSIITMIITKLLFTSSKSEIWLQTSRLLVFLNLSPFSSSFTDFFVKIRESFDSSGELFPSLKEMICECRFLWLLFFGYSLDYRDVLETFLWTLHMALTSLRKELDNPCAPG